MIRFHLPFEVGGSNATDGCTDVHQIGNEPLKFSEFPNFPFRLAQRSTVRKGLRESLAFRLVREPEVRAVSWISSLGTATTRLPAFSYRRAYRSGPKIFESRNFFEDSGSLIREKGKGFRHERELIIESLSPPSLPPERIPYAQVKNHKEMLDSVELPTYKRGHENDSVLLKFPLSGGPRRRADLG